MKIIFVHGSSEDRGGRRTGGAMALRRPPHAGGSLGAGLLGNAAELCAASMSVGAEEEGEGGDAA